MTTFREYAAILIDGLLRYVEQDFRLQQESRSRQSHRSRLPIFSPSHPPSTPLSAFSPIHSRPPDPQPPHSPTERQEYEEFFEVPGGRARRTLDEEPRRSSPGPSVRRMSEMETGTLAAELVQKLLGSEKARELVVRVQETPAQQLRPPQEGYTTVAPNAAARGCNHVHFRNEANAERKSVVVPDVAVIEQLRVLLGVHEGKVAPEEEEEEEEETVVDRAEQLKRLLCLTAKENSDSVKGSIGCTMLGDENLVKEE